MDISIQCDKVLSNSSCLKKHNFVHTGAKQFTCHQCGKTFSKSGNLKTHKLSRTGEIEFACTQREKLSLSQVT